LAALEILSVSTPEETPDQLWGASIDRPLEGHTADEPLVHVAAWAIGRSAPAVAVELISDNRVLALAPLRTPRPDLVAAFSQVPEAAHAGMAVDVDTSELPEDFEIVLTAVLQTGERLEIGSIKGKRGEPSEPEVPAAPTLKDEVTELLRRIAPESLDAGRHEDGALLDRIRLNGQRVLVLGAGLGDVCRAARARGAALVDGLEPDERLVRVAGLVNAFHHTTRVSIYQRDVARPDAYSEPYDVVVVLSPFDVVVGALDKIAGNTDGVLVVRLPDLDENLALLNASFQHHEVLDADRGLVAAARTRDALAAALQPGDAVTQAAQ
jgi:hypothetical protein